ncbi:MAG: nucleoside triphosphate pyrophosphohydrolase [candidate division NC10 bacterium]
MLSNRKLLYNAAMSGDSFPEGDMGQFQTLIETVARLRAPGGCPWDREQTHASLKRNLLEEVYEVLEAIDLGDASALSEELGDLLVQVAFHAQIAREAGEFDLNAVLGQVNRKLVRRHPHVFGGVPVGDAREVERNWERLKEAERGPESARKSPADGIPDSLPALTYAQLMQDRVGRDGFEWEDLSGVLDKVVEEAEELRRAASDQEKLHELGDLLFSMVNLCRWRGVHAEDALRQANRRFRQRYIGMEDLAAQRGLDFRQLPLSQKEELWQEAKLREGR